MTMTTTCIPASGTNINKAQLPDNALVLPPTPQLQALLTIIRDEKTQRYFCPLRSQLTPGVTLSCKHTLVNWDHGAQFSTSDRIIRLLTEEGLNMLPTIPRAVRTPVGKEYDGVAFQGRICGVSIMRGETVGCRETKADSRSWRGKTRIPACRLANKQ